MSLVDVVVPRARAAEVVRRMHVAGVVHLVPFDVPPGDESGVFTAGSAGGDGHAVELRARMARLDELLAAVGGCGAPAALLAECWELPDAALQARLEPLETVRSEAAALRARRDLLVAERARLAWFGELAASLTGTDLLHIPPGYECLAVVVGRHDAHAIDLVEEELVRLTGGRCAVVRTGERMGRVGAVMVMPADLADDAHAMLGSRRLDDVPVPSEIAGVPLAEVAGRLAASENAIDEQVGRLDARLAELRSEHGALAAAGRLVLRDRVAEDGAFPAAGSSRHLVVFSGWVPARRLRALRDALGSDAAVSERVPTAREREHAPAALSNARPVRPFEPLVSFVGLPRSETVDPTPALAIAFPLFVGFMVGDAGYGLLLLALLAVARHRWHGSRLVSAVLPVATIAALSTIAFGILFGEWFGDAGSALGLRPLWLDRRVGVPELLAVAVGVGVLQISLGLVLGVVNGLRLGERREVLSRAGELACLAGLLGMLGAQVGLLPGLVAIPAAALFTAGSVAVVVAVRFIAPIELVGVFGNVLSYARLMAIALASAMLATVANTLGGLAGNLVLAVVIAGTLHALNFCLGFFDATIQGLRLHYVEFFSKFVERGQVTYRPFAAAIGPEPERWQASHGH